jgi:hypothetical protein
VKIIKIDFTDYGPLKAFSLIPESLTCVYGANESGKTAVVDVLTYILFKRTVANLRYPKPGSVHITIEEGEKTHTLPSKKRTLMLPIIDIAPLLYVHESQSRIFTDNTKGRFWDSLKTVLSGMESGITFAKLDEKIFMAVGLQPKKKQWKQEKQEAIDNENARKKVLSDFISRISEIEHIRTEKQRLLQERKSLEAACAAITAWNKHEDYLMVSNAYSAYRDTTVQLQDFERYKTHLLERWQELDVQKRTSAKDDSKVHLLDNEIAELGKKKMELQRKQDFIDAWDIASTGANDQHITKPKESVVPYAISAVLTIFFILSFFTPIPTLVASIALFLSMVFSGYWLYRILSTRRKTTRHQEIIEKGKSIFPEITGLSDLMKAIDHTQDEMIRVSTLLAEKNDIRQHLSDRTSQSAVNKELNEIREKTGLAEIDDLKDKLEKKKHLEHERDKLRIELRSMLKEQNENRWERLIDKMKVPAPHEKPDVSTEQDLHDRLSKLERSIRDLEHQIAVFKEIQQTTYQVDDPRSAFLEFDRIEKKLQEYDLEKKAALAARKIFADMSKEQDDYIEDVITGDQSLSAFFKTVTGQYEKVTIRNKDFVVQDTHGNEYPIDTLSSGTRDQLLLCFRFAALQKTYPKGIFLILDDAFIFADWQRREKLMDLIMEFVKKGNQVIYFTSDDHTRDLFEAYGAQVTILS